MLRTFAVIGDPIDHSLSPTIHNAAYRHLDLECTYIGYKINKNELESGIQSLKAIKISGFCLEALISPSSFFSVSCTWCIKGVPLTQVE